MARKNPHGSAFRDGRHASQPSVAAAAQHPNRQGFGLIGSMMSQQEMHHARLTASRRQYPISRLSGPFGNRRPSFQMRDIQPLGSNPQGREPRYRHRRLDCGFGAEAVIDNKCQHPAASGARPGLRQYR